jgi:hypothetical protein
MRLASETLDAVADRGYYEGDEIKSCEEAGITVTLPKLQTSSAKAEGRFGKQDFVYVAAEDVYRCPAGTLRFQRTALAGACPVAPDCRAIFYAGKMISRPLDPLQTGHGRLIGYIRWIDLHQLRRQNNGLPA